MKYFTEAELLEALRRAYTAGWAQGNEQGRLGQTSMMSEDYEDCETHVSHIAKT